MTKSEIIARLQNGETMDDIAAEISTMMTEAEDEYAAIQKAEEEKKMKETKKIHDAAKIALELQAFLAEWYPEADIESFPANGCQIIDWIDKTLQFDATINAFADSIPSRPEVKVIHSSDASDIIKSLFRAL